jgi:hypothetical protein
MSLGAPEAPDALVPGPANGTADEAFRAVAAGDDPIAAQSLLCKELSRLAAPSHSGDAALHAVLALDAHAQRVGKRLLTAYAEGDDEARAFDARYLISARLLSRSFAQAYERLLAHFQAPAAETWRRNVVTVLVHLFRHRQAELLLRLLRYKRDSSEQWRQVHMAYRFAQANAMDQYSLAIVRDDAAADDRTVHHHFIELLLVGVMNTGQLSPRELVWASQWLAAWSTLLALRPVDAKVLPRADAGFVVDLDGNEGLTRLEAGARADLHLDTAPLIARIDEEIAVLNEPPDDEPFAPSSGRDAAIALLAKLRIMFSPHPVQFNRRGEREVMSATVQSMCGLRHAVRVVREEAHSRAGSAPATGRQRDGITISPGNGAADSFPGTVFHAATSHAPLTISSPTIRSPGTWQAKDWSDSGCRLRGRAADLNDVIPGSLICIREHQDAPWTVAIVRRLRRLMVDHVEISLEFIGRKPRFVKLIAARSATPSADEEPNGKRKTFGALYLPLSEKRPTLPIKTMLVPVAAFEEGRVMTLMSSEARYSLRFNKALEHHADFVWTTFTLIARR